MGGFREVIINVKGTGVGGRLGYEGGGHTGEVASMVLWPEVVRAVAPTPVLAAGGIGSGEQIAAALALGAAGTWSGSLWLTVEEAAGAGRTDERGGQDQMPHLNLAGGHKKCHREFIH